MADIQPPQAARQGSNDSGRSGSSLETMSTHKSMRDLLDAGLVKEGHDNYLHAPWYILRPVSSFMSGWDLLTTLALLFTAAITPFEVAFLEKAESTNDGLFVANRLLDVIFVLDMTFQFFLMFRVGRDEGSGTYWEYRLPQIALHYVKGWFALDVLSIFPSAFDILPFVPGSGFSSEGGAANLRVLRVVRTTRLLKLVRLARSSRLVTRWRTRISITFATLTVIALALCLVVATHWLACLLALQTIFANSRTETWFGAFGWCTAVEGGEEYEDECAPAEQLYVACLHWAFGIISGYFSDPHSGPYERTPRAVGEGASSYTVGEMFVNLVLLVVGALGWAYVTGKIVDIIVNANPDQTDFKNRMDDLNRYIAFYDLKPDVAQQLREYFYETKMTKAAEARRAIVSEMSSELQEQVCDLINRQWLDTVPFFRGMTAPDGAVVVRPVERGFLAKVATQLECDVFAPMEKPPSGRLYVISKGSARYKGTVRSNGFSWGALDVMLPNAPLVKQAIATTYLHVMWIDGEKLRDIAMAFPASRRSMRQWTLFNGLKEYMLDNLRHASAAERARARAYLEERRRAASTPQIFRRVVRRMTNAKRAFVRKRLDANTIAELHAAIDTRFDGLCAAVRAIEKRLDGGGSDSAAATPAPSSASATPAATATSATEPSAAAGACWSAASRAQPPQAPDTWKGGLPPPTEQPIAGAASATPQPPAAPAPAPASVRQKKHGRGRKPTQSTAAASASSASSRSSAPAPAPSAAEPAMQDPMEC